MKIKISLKRITQFSAVISNLIRRQICRSIVILQIFVVTGCLAVNPQIKEFRGVWIATINNLDWPSAPGLPVEEQKRELKELIESIEKLNLNVVIFQVRPAADAFYKSETEPWSYFLTARQGSAPSAFFDPLQYAIDVCHSKGMELHAWFNPFRVRNLGYYVLDPHSFAAKHPQYIHEYDHKLFLDPGYPQVREYVNRVIMEVVRKYDIDAVHFDDYFYPYPVNGVKYPDMKTFRQYGKSFYPKGLADWRRNNINQFIASVHDSIKTVKPNLKLGVSPFGIWRNERDDPNGSPGARGTSSYDDLYADVYHWLSNDWIDYVIPQIYWEQGNRFGDFEAMVRWWNDHSFGKPVYVGQALFKSTGEDKVFSNPMEITEQIGIIRKFDKIGGFSLYSASHLARLSDKAFHELTLSLAPPREEIPRMEVLSNNLENLSQGLADPKRDRIIMAEKRSLSDSLNILYKSFINQNLEVPEQFSIIKSNEGREISWNLNHSTEKHDFIFAVIVFERNKGGGYKRKILSTSDQKKLFISRKSDINPARVMFSVISIQKNGMQSAFSKLFRIRGKRIIYI